VINLTSVQFVMVLSVQQFNMQPADSVFWCSTNYAQFLFDWSIFGVTPGRAGPQKVNFQELLWQYFLQAGCPSGHSTKSWIIEGWKLPTLVSKSCRI